MLTALERHREWKRRDKILHPERWQEYNRRSALKRKFGLTEAEYDAQLKAQGGVCAICGKPPRKWRLSVDHDHKTGRLRGLLCWWCNKFVLNSRMTQEVLRKAADYLESPTWIEERFVPGQQRGRGWEDGWLRKRRADSAPTRG